MRVDDQLTSSSFLYITGLGATLKHLALSKLEWVPFEVVRTMIWELPLLEVSCNDTAKSTYYSRISSTFVTETAKHVL